MLFMAEKVVAAKFPHTASQSWRDEGKAPTLLLLLLLPSPPPPLSFTAVLWRRYASLQAPQLSPVSTEWWWWWCALREHIHSQPAVFSLLTRGILALSLSLTHFQSQFCVHVLAQCSLYYSLYCSASLVADWKATSLSNACSCCSQCGGGGGVCSVQLFLQFDARQESECITITIAIIIIIISDCVFGVSFGRQN